MDVAIQRILRMVDDGLMDGDDGWDRGIEGV